MDNGVLVDLYKRTKRKKLDLYVYLKMSLFDSHETGLSRFILLAVLTCCSLLAQLNYIVNQTRLFR